VSKRFWKTAAIVQFIAIAYFVAYDAYWAWQEDHQT